MMDIVNGQLMGIVAVVFLFGTAFSQDYDYPTYSDHDMPVTSFSCEDKRHGQYYADVETGCQMYHVCARDKYGVMESNRFLCGNGTVYDQRKHVCEDYRKVNCRDSTRYYRYATDREISFNQLKIEKRNQALLREQQLAFDYDYPTYSDLDMPITSFSCEDKRHGQYYADVETGCQMYHICAKDKYGVMESNRFLCGNGTVFDQRKHVCEDYHKVNCRDSTRYYRYATDRDISFNQLKIEKRNQAILREQQLAFRPEYYPTYSKDNMPDTKFSCDDKIHGGYYADLETDCQMYHICARDKYGAMERNRFLCGNGTVFDQRRLVCQEHWKVNCQESPKYYENASPRQQMTNLKKLELRYEGMEKERLRAEEIADRDYDYAPYSELDFPETSFTCNDKRNGGYYADIEADCRMYHVCSRDKLGFMTDTRFLCGNGTVFDQRHLVCQEARKVQNCKDSPRFYRSAATSLLYHERERKSEKRDKEIRDAGRFDSRRE